jgi:uncharacterized protein
MIAGDLVQIARAAPPSFHILEGTLRLVLAVEGSRIFAIPDDWNVADMPPAQAPELCFPEHPNAISLNVAQACNLSCSYCYADEGRFGERPRLMQRETAFRSIDWLIRSNAGQRVSVGFIGGEPLLNRQVVHEATHYAAARAKQAGLTLSFGITTNATLLDPADVRLFREYGFAITVSLDGSREQNDLQRRARSGSAHAQALRNIRPLLDSPGSARIAARCTITALDLDIASRVRNLVEAGFPEVGVSPLRTSPKPGLALADGDWAVLLGRMVEAATLDWESARRGGMFRFSNLAVALKQLDAGSCRALPCGAGASYVSIDAEGKYYTCHRTIGQPFFDLGSGEFGPDPAMRRHFTSSRLVDKQEPCRSCWARYLCGGGCHAEVVVAGRKGCDFIRGWLEFCIRLYPEVLRARPDLLGVEVKECSRG